MEWLKKHWEIITAIAVGIPLLYWLYQTYIANQAASAQASQDATANADALASAQQLADAGYGGYYSGSGDSSGGGSTIASPVTTPVSMPVTPGPVSATPISPSNSPLAGVGYPTTPETVISSGPQLPGYHFDGVALVADTPTTNIVTTPPSAIETLFGSGGGNNDTAPVAVQGSTPDPSILTHITDGTIPQHGTALRKSPTPIEMSSLGGR